VTWGLIGCIWGMGHPGPLDATPLCLVGCSDSRACPARCKRRSGASLAPCMKNGRIWGAWLRGCEWARVSEHAETQRVHVGKARVTISFAPSPSRICSRPPLPPGTPSHHCSPGRLVVSSPPSPLSPSPPLVLHSPRLLPSLYTLPVSSPLPLHYSLPFSNLCVIRALTSPHRAICLQQ
jgi:hypothetical protein